MKLSGTLETYLHVDAAAKCDVNEEDEVDNTHRHVRAKRDDLHNVGGHGSTVGQSRYAKQDEEWYEGAERRYKPAANDETVDATATYDRQLEKWSTDGQVLYRAEAEDGQRVDNAESGTREHSWYHVD